MHPLLTFDKIKKSYFGAPALRGVSLALTAGTIVGLVGENGAGKSTLMNILGGVVEAEAGEMQWEGQPYTPRTPADAKRNGIAFVHQELNLFANLSIAENIFVPSFLQRKRFGLTTLDYRAMHTRTQELLAQVNLAAAPDALLETLSPGERQQVEIAKAISQSARLIIFDEPTTSLTTREIENLFALILRLRAQGTTIIYISHVLSDIFRLCDDIVVLRDGAVVGAGAKHEFTTESLIALMVGRSLEQLYPTRQTPPQSEIALQVSELSQPGVIENISFALHKGEVLGIGGLMGAGRTELVRILFGLDAHSSGHIKLNGIDVSALSVRERIQQGLAFLTEERRAEGLMMDAAIVDNVALAALPNFSTTPAHWLAIKRLQTTVQEAIEAAQIRGTDLAQQTVRTLSGGNQQKVVLAKWLLCQPAVLLLDEPTRGVDVGARAEIYRLINQLAEQGAGVLLISSEIEELIGLSDRILVMQRGAMVAEFARAAFDRAQILATALQANDDANIGRLRHDKNQ